MPRDTTVGWVVDESGIAVISPLGSICEMEGADDFTLEEMESHARLIASAPQLLKSAQAAHHLCLSLLAVREGASDGLIISIAGSLRVAIAKAEGRR